MITDPVRAVYHFVTCVSVLEYCIICKLKCLFMTYASTIADKSVMLTCKLCHDICLDNDIEGLYIRGFVVAQDSCR